MAGLYGLHYFMFCCVVVASGGAGQSDGGAEPQPGQQPNAEPGGVVGRLDELQDLLELLLERAEQDSVALGTQLQLIDGKLTGLEQDAIQTTGQLNIIDSKLTGLEQDAIQTTEQLNITDGRLTALEQDAIQTTELLQIMDGKLTGLSIAITELAQCNKITCPEGYDTPCGDVCYRLEGDTWCWIDGGRGTVPMSQNHIDCLLTLTKEKDLPVYTYYLNDNGANFTSMYDSSVVAPADLVHSVLGPGGDIDQYGLYTDVYVFIDRTQRKLVRSGFTGWVAVCEKPPLE